LVFSFDLLQALQCSENSRVALSVVEFLSMFQVRQKSRLVIASDYVATFLGDRGEHKPDKTASENVEYFFHDFIPYLLSVPHHRRRQFRRESCSGIVCELDIGIRTPFHGTTLL